MDEEGAPHLQNSPYIQGSNRYHFRLLYASIAVACLFLTINYVIKIN